MSDWLLFMTVLGCMLAFLFLMPPMVWLGTKVFIPFSRLLGRWARYWGMP